MRRIAPSGTQQDTVAAAIVGVDVLTRRHGYPPSQPFASDVLVYHRARYLTGECQFTNIAFALGSWSKRKATAEARPPELTTGDTNRIACGMT
jgi:hypothetical protein